MNHAVIRRILGLILLFESAFLFALHGGSDLQEKQGAVLSGSCFLSVW